MRCQPRKMSLAACISRCPTTTRSPCVRVVARAQEALEHRRLGLLDLEEQRVVVVAADQQHDVAAGADAADADHLPRRVHVAELLERVVPVAERVPVRGEQLLDHRRGVLPARCRGRPGPRSARSAAGRRRCAVRRRPCRPAWRARGRCRGCGPSRPCPRPPAPRLAHPLGRDLLADQLQQLADLECSYQASQLPMPAAGACGPRYSRTPAMTIARRSAGLNPRSRPITSTLAASRFTSHSHGPGSVSSKSLTSKSICRSGVPNRPKFDRWASPQSWTVIAGRGCAGEVGGHDRAPRPGRR